MTTLFVSPLTARQQAIVDMVLWLGQVRSQHITRLYFADNSERSREIRMRRTMLTLYRRGLVGRLERDIGMGGAGSNGYVYVPPRSTREIPSLHTLAVTELYVQLVEASRRGECQIVATHIEDEAYYKVGGTEIRPDMFLRLRTSRGLRSWNIEIDRATEYRARDRSKLRAYKQASEGWDIEVDGKFFPTVLYVVPSVRRFGVIERRIRESRVGDLVAVCLSGDAVKVLTA